MSLEGALHITVRTRGGRWLGLGITSTRPDVARLLLQGRTRAEVAAAVPLLFSVCGRSQTAAAELACAAACGEAPSADTLTRCGAAVSAEIVRESALRALLDWPRWNGEQPGSGAVAAARACMASGPDAPAREAAAAIAHAAFGAAADDWLALASPTELDRWIDAGSTATARWVRRVRDDDAAHPVAAAAPATLLLAGHGEPAWLSGLGVDWDADPEFHRHPTWRGRPAECGALARLQSETLIGAWMQRSASRAPARFIARLRELALLLSGRTAAAVGVRTLADGSGIAWVENARGLLVHRVDFDGERVRRYRIVTPTDWNFHPGGALASAMTGRCDAELRGVKSSLERLVQSLDPCVACPVEVDDA